MKKLITNIAQLVNIREKNQLLRGSDQKTLPILENAYLFINDGIIESYGPMQELRSKKWMQQKQLMQKEVLLCPAGAIVIRIWYLQHHEKKSL
jgi:imidazolonepropionase